MFAPPPEYETTAPTWTPLFWRRRRSSAADFLSRSPLEGRERRAGPTGTVGPEGPARLEAPLGPLSVKSTRFISTVFQARESGPAPGGPSKIESTSRIWVRVLLLAPSGFCKRRKPGPGSRFRVP